MLMSTSMASAQAQIGSPHPKNDPPAQAITPPPPPSPRALLLPPDQRYPPRAVGAGAKYGLVVGTIVGAAAGVLAVLIFEIEDDDDLSLGTKATVISFLGLTGAATGGLLGAWTGSLISRNPKDGQPRGTLPIRSLALTGGYADFTATDQTDGGFQGRATLYSHFEPWLAVGAEYGLLTGSPHCWRLAAGVRVDPFPMTQTVRPYLAGSIGGNFWQGSENLLSADAGIGIELPYKRGRSAVGLEARYHFNLQNAVEPGTYRYASIGLTWRIDS